MAFNFSNIVSAAQGAFQKLTTGIPADAYSVAEVAQKHIDSGTFVQKEEKFDKFFVFDCSSDKKQHVVYRYEAKKLYSIYRSANPHEIEMCFNRFLQQRTLFELAAATNFETFTALVSDLHLHPRWLSIHIAAKIGLSKLFRSDHGCSDLAELCMPDGVGALHLAVQNDHDEIVAELIKRGVVVGSKDAHGANAFHYAVHVSPDMVKVLSRQAPCITAPPSPESEERPADATNHQGFTPLFAAVRAGRSDCVRTLLEEANADPLKTCHGRTALAEAMSAGNNESMIECIGPLVAYCPQLAMQCEPGTGNTPLHEASDSKMLRFMLDNTAAHIDVNMRNKYGQTPLHTQIDRGRELSSLVRLICYGANMNLQDNDGRVPLHIAVGKAKTSLVKVLLIFGANASVQTAEGSTPLHLANKLATGKSRDDIVYMLQVCHAKRCSKDKTGCGKICEYKAVSKPVLEPVPVNRLHQFMQAACVKSVKEKRSNLPPVPPPRTGGDGPSKLPSLINVLAFDGGGIRGLVLTQILGYIEDQLPENSTRLFDKFHWVAGTSTGAILATALSQGKSIRDCQRLYFRFKDEVFKGFMRPYDSNVLESFIKLELSEDKRMSDIRNPRLFLTTVNAEYNPLKLQLFRNYQIPIDDDEVLKEVNFIDPRDVFVWKANRCSSAAPSYFSTFEKKYVDGGLIANNPTLDLLTEIQLYNSALRYSNRSAETVEVGCVLSIGTGKIPNTPINSKLDLGMPENPLDAVLKTFAIRDLGTLLIDQICATDGAPVERCRSWCHMVGTPFFRLSTPMSKEIAMDTKDDNVLIQVCWETMEYMYRHHEEVVQLIDLLYS